MLRLRQSSAMVLLIILSASILSLRSPLIPSVPSVDGATHNIALVGTFAGWNNTSPPSNPPIAVTRGDTVNLSLSSGDSTHNFYIDISRDAIKQCPKEKCSDDFPPDIPPLSFVVDMEPGTYTYYCSIHQGAMFGDFVVQGFTVASSPSSLRIVQGFSNMSTIAVTSVNSFAGIVDLSTAVLPATPNSPLAVLNPPSVTLFPDQTQFSTLTASTSGSTVPGNYNVNVTGTSGSAWGSRVVPVLVVPPDFNINANPARLVVPVGSSKNSTITLSSVDTFSGSVDLSSSSLPSGITVTLTPPSVTLTSGGSANSTLEVSVSPTFAQPGTYTLNVTGTSGSLAHTTTLTVVAGPDFDISVSPTALSLTPGSSGTSIITLNSLNNFTGTANISGSIQPDGPTFTIAPSDPTIPDGGTATATLTIDASAAVVAANYTVTMHATSGLLNHSLQVLVSVRDFSLAVSNANLTVQRGSSPTITLSITSLNNFVNVVNLTTTATSIALSLGLNITSISFDSSDTEYAGLTIDSTSVPVGTYTVSITGTSGSLVRTVSLSITVQPSSGGASILPLIGGAVVAGIAVASGVLYYSRRRRLRGRRSDSQVPT